MLNQKLQLKLSQKLSPQQIQLMKLIQLSTLEFEQKLSREIEENPALDSTNESQENDSDEFDIDDSFEKEEVNNDEIDNNTLLIVRAGLHSSFNISKHIPPPLLILQ